MARLRRAARRALRAVKKVTNILKRSKPEIPMLVDSWGRESMWENFNGPTKRLVKGLKRRETLIATLGEDGVLIYFAVPETLELLRELPKIKVPWEIPTAEQAAPAAPVAPIVAPTNVPGVERGFKKLSCELQVKIWEYAVPESGGTIHIQAVPATFNMARLDQPRRLYDRLTFHHCPYYHTLPATMPSSLDRSLTMLSICKESRKIYKAAFPLIMPFSTCRKKDGQCICKFPTYPVCKEHSNALIPYEGRLRFSQEDALFIRNFADVQPWILNQWIMADAPNWSLSWGIRKLVFNLELANGKDNVSVDNLVKFIREFEGLKEVVFVDRVLPPVAWELHPLRTPHVVIREVIERRDRMERWLTMGDALSEEPLASMPEIKYEDPYAKFRNWLSYAVEVIEPGTGGMKYVKEFKEYKVECSCNPDGPEVSKPKFDIPSWWNGLTVPRDLRKRGSGIVRGG